MTLVAPASTTDAPTTPAPVGDVSPVEGAAQAWDCEDDSCHFCRGPETD